MTKFTCARVLVSMVCICATSGRLLALQVDDAQNSKDKSSIARSVNPVVELRNQDSALSLLMAAYREIQGYMIESDYEARLQAAASLPDAKSRRQVEVLAAQERVLRMKKLEDQLSNMMVAYDYARQMDERDAGVQVPNTVNTEAASRKLQDFVVIVPDNTNIVETIATKSVPFAEVISFRSNTIQMIQNPIASTQANQPMTNARQSLILAMPKDSVRAKIPDREFRAGTGELSALLGPSRAGAEVGGFNIQGRLDKWRFNDAIGWLKGKLWLLGTWFGQSSMTSIEPDPITERRDID